MEWFIFALLAPVLFAGTNIIDKFVLTNKIRNPYTYNIITMSLNIIPIMILALYLQLSFTFSALLSILDGAIFVGLYLLYNKSMMLDDVSRISSLMRISPLFLLVFSFIFLGEVLSYKQYAGALLLVSSALVVSYQRVKKKIHLSKGILLILFYAAGLAIMGIFTKYVLGSIDYWSFFFWNLIGNMLGCGILISLPNIRKRLRKDISGMDKKLMLTILFVDLIAWSGYLLWYIAVSIGYVSLVSAIGSIQPMIVFIFTIAITIHKPHILKEEISKKSLLLKSLAVILIFIGSYLIVVE